MKAPCGFCGGPDTARMVRRPYGTVCWSCARYIDARGTSVANALAPHVRRRVIDHFNWADLRTDMENMVYADDGSDPFDFLPQKQQSNTSSAS